MANFDSNSWHIITVAAGQYPNYSLAGDELSEEIDTVGAVHMREIDPQFARQYWQIFRYNSTFYVLRTEGSGSLGYSGVQFDKEEETPGKTIPVTRNVSVSDDSMFWRIGPWGDGTFWLSNGANGSEWRLTVKVPFTGVAMSSNITAPQDGQRFSFEQSDPIDDVAYSSVITPTPVLSTSSSTVVASRTAGSTLAMTTIPATTASLLTPSTTPPPQGNKGMPKGTAAAIGASVGGVVLVTALVFAFIFVRRRRKGAVNSEPTTEPPTAQFQPKELPAEQVSSRHLSTEVPAYSTT